MAYRVRVTWSESEGAFVLDARSAALLCLADGDELVVERVEHRSSPLRARGARTGPAARLAPAAPASAPAAAPDTPPPAATVTPLPGRERDELAALKRALRLLGN